MVIDLIKLVRKYNIPSDHIVHAGAHIGQELKLYDELNCKTCWLFEPQPQVFAKLVESAMVYKWPKLYNIALGSREEKLNMFVSEGNDGQSSSFLEPHLHITQYNYVKFGKVINEIPVVTLDSLLENNKDFKPTILSMDTQGFELEILKGGTKALSTVNLIITEFSTEQLYKGTALLKDLDNFLSFYGFSRIETVWQAKNWGDAAYLRK